MTLSLSAGVIMQAGAPMRCAMQHVVESEETDRQVGSVRLPKLTRKLAGCRNLGRCDLLDAYAPVREMRMPSFCMRDCSVDRFMPSSAAAPLVRRRSSWLAPARPVPAAARLHPAAARILRFRLPDGMRLLRPRGTAAVAPASADRRWGPLTPGPW